MKRNTKVTHKNTIYLKWKTVKMIADFLESNTHYTGQSDLIDDKMSELLKGLGYDCTDAEAKELSEQYSQ